MGVRCTREPQVRVTVQCYFIFREIMDGGIWDKKKNPVHRHINGKHEARWKTQAMDTL